MLCVQENTSMRKILEWDSSNILWRYYCYYVKHYHILRRIDRYRFKREALSCFDKKYQTPAGFIFHYKRELVDLYQHHRALTSQCEFSD